MMLRAFVDLAALDRSGRTEGAADRLRQRFRAVGDEQAPWQSSGRAPRETEVAQQGLNRCGISRSPLPPAPADACCLRRQPRSRRPARSSPRCSPSIWTTRRSSADRSAAMKSARPRRRQRYEPPRGRRLRNPRSGRCRHVTLGQPDSAAEPARRHIDQHQVHRPTTKPILLRRRFL